MTREAEYSIVLRRRSDKDHKSCVRFDHDNADAGIHSLYVQKDVLPDSPPDKIEVTLSW